MKDKDKTQKQPTKELTHLRRRIAELEASGRKRTHVEETLRQSEEKYRTILENIEDGYYEVDLAGNFTFLNDSMCRIQGYPSDELVGMNNRDYMDKETAKKVYKIFNTALRTGKSATISDWQIIRKDGSLRDVESSVSLIRDANRNPVGFRGVIRDITERKQAEQALQKSEEKYRTVVELSPDGVAIASKGRHVFANQSLAKIFGVSGPEELVGKPIMDYIHPDYRKTVLKRIAEQTKSGVSAPLIEEKMLRADGTVIDTEVAATPLEYQGEQAVLAIIRDITERKQAEDALQESEERFRLAFENANTGVSLVDIEGNLLRVNNKMCEIFGYTKEELERMPVNDIAHPADIDKSPEFIQKTLQGEIDRATFEKRYIHKKGHVVTCEVSSSLVRNAEGAPLYFISHVHDITERKQAEDKVRESKQLLEKTFLSLRDALLIIDANTLKILDCNPATSEIFGYDRNEIVGQSVNVLHVEEKTLEEFRSHLYAAIETHGFLSRFEFKMKRKGGMIFPTEHSVIPIGDEQGNRIRWVSMVRDITELKKAEKELRESGEKFRLAFENANIGVCLVDFEGNLTKVNTKMCEIFGYTKEDLERMTVNDIAHPADIDKSPEFIQKTLQGEIDRATFEKRYIHKKGHVVTCDVSSSLVRDAEGAPLYFISHIHDITDRKQAEAQIARALRETRLRFEISQALAGAQTEDEVLDVLIQHAGFYPQVFVVIYTFDRTEGEIAAIVRRQNPFESGLTPMLPIGSRLPVSNYTLLGRISPDQPFVSDDILADEKIETYGRDILTKTGVASIAVFPLMIDNEWMCLIMTMAKSIGCFDEEKQNLYRTLAEQGAVALRAARLREQIRESQQRFQGLVETLSDWIWEVDQNGIYTYASPKIRDLLEYEPDEVLGKTPFDLMPIEEAERVKAIFESLVATQQPIVALENTCLHKDGRLVVFETSGVPFFDAEGRLKGYRGVNRDITERKRAEEELKERQETINAIIETSQDWIWAIDRQGVHTYSNPAIEKILGYRTEEIVGSVSLNLIHEDDKKMVESILQDCEEKRCGWSNLLLRWRHKNGTYRYLESNAVPILNSKGDLIGFRGVDRDITDRKQAEKAVRDSEERFRTLVENASEGIFVQTDYRFAYINAAMLHIFGAERPEQLLGQSVMDRFHPDFREQVRERIRLLNEEKKHVPMLEQTYLRLDGSYVQVEVSAAPIVYDEKNGAVVFVRDITARKQAEEEVKRGYEQLQETLHSTVKALASTVEMKDQYTAGHQPRVTQLACAIAEEMGLSAEQIEGIRMAASIHDIGKLMVPAEILNKPGPLTEIQFEMIKMHPRAGYDILKGLKLPWPVAQIILQHNERNDGSGYPQGLSGEEILVEAKILTVANVVEAMTAHRPYRPAYDIKEALAEISKNRGTLYDATVVDACLRLFTEKGFILDSVPG